MVIRAIFQGRSGDTSTTSASQIGTNTGIIKLMEPTGDHGADMQVEAQVIGTTVTVCEFALVTCL